MNKLIISLTVFLIITFGLKAQDFPSYDNNDITISYGLFAPDQFMNVESSMLNKQFEDMRYVRDDFSSIGNIFLAYRKLNRAETVMWGVTLGYGSNKSKIYYIGQYAGELNRKFFTVAAEMQYRYVNRGIIQVYSGLGLGLTYGQETLSKSAIHPEESNGTIIRPAYQLNVAGVRIGNKFAGFIEFGYGCKGILNFGLSIQH
ncbi:MAG: hypothetical protein C0595_01245 [Marinilabiliales bacterium]|nr:MAG: hypothetical protein C0595_01245 [Marinilabiliales bacterium]